MKRLILLVAICFTVLGVMLFVAGPFSKEARLRSSAVQYATEVLPPIIQDWDPAVLRSHFSRRCLESYSEDKSKTISDYNRQQVGDLVRIDKIGFVGNGGLKGSGSRWYMVRADCTFQLGREKVWLWLVREDNDWRIDGLTTSKG